MKLLLVVCFKILVFILNIGNQFNIIPCEKLPDHFSSYQEALNIIKSSQFKISETVNTSKSSWIKAASFYSCDGQTGFFIFKAGAKEYIHRDMPYQIWVSFKRAASFGSYYQLNIKGKYQLII